MIALKAHSHLPAPLNLSAQLARTLTDPARYMSVNRYDTTLLSSPGAASATHGFLVAAPAPACTSACCGAPPLTAASLAAHLRAVLGADTQRASVQQRDAAAATTGVAAAEIVETLCDTL